VLRTAELALEVPSTSAAETRVAELVERLGGYVASSERLTNADEGEPQQARVSLTLRVPSEKLGSALRELKRLGAGAETERLGSEDVTDEYMDLEARIANQRHLETQLVILLAKTDTVESALKVHQELANVRTEIDRMEGRRRFLANETELAKIALTLSPLRPVVAISMSELGVSARRAASDSVAVAAGVVTGCIRLAGIVLPLTLLFGLPAFGLWRFAQRRRRQQHARAALSA